VLARALEAEGIATTSISMVREHTEKVKPPRALFVPFPFGHALGRPNDPALQHNVLRAALKLFTAPAGPVLTDFPDDAGPGDEPPAPAQASAIAPSPRISDDPALEVARLRQHHAQWQARNGGRTALGLTGVPPARFEEIVRFLQAFANGEDADTSERRAEVTLPAFIRWCADDLKALFFEGHLAMKPLATGDEIARWFWGQTATGELVRRVGERLANSDDPQWKAAAFGVAR
jgi:hypothetical protein